MTTLPKAVSDTPGGVSARHGPLYGGSVNGDAALVTRALAAGALVAAAADTITWTKLSAVLPLLAIAVTLLWAARRVTAAERAGRRR